MLIPILGRRRPHGYNTYQVNWGHALGKDLRFAYAPLHGKATDYCRPRSATSENTLYTKQFGLTGKCVFSNASTSDLGFTGSGTKFTIAAFVDAAFDQGALRRMSGGTGWTLYYNFSSSGNWEFFVNDSIIVSAARIAGDQFFMVTSDGSTFTIYINGRSKATAAATTISSTSATMQVVEAGSFGVYGAFAWGRCLSAREALLWAAHPFQMLAVVPHRTRAFPSAPAISNTGFLSLLAA